MKAVIPRASRGSFFSKKQKSDLSIITVLEKSTLNAVGNLSFSDSVKVRFLTPGHFYRGPRSEPGSQLAEVGELETGFVKVDSFRRVVCERFDTLPEETKPSFEKRSKRHISHKTQKVRAWIHLSLSLAP